MNTKNNKVEAKYFLRKLVGPVSFGQMIRAWRLSQELGLVEMANLLGISKQDLCNIEKGRKLVSVERAVSFAKSLNMSEKVFAVYALQDQLRKAGIEGEITINT